MSVVDGDDYDRLKAKADQFDAAKAEADNLRGALVTARQTIVVACGTDAPYVRVSLDRIDSALRGLGVPVQVAPLPFDAIDAAIWVEENSRLIRAGASRVPASVRIKAQARELRALASRHMDAGKETVCQAEAPEGADLLFTSEPEKVTCGECLSIMAMKKFENEGPLICVDEKCGGEVKPVRMFEQTGWECDRCSVWFNHRDVIVSMKATRPGA